MNNLKVGAKLALGFGVAILAIIYIGISSYISLGKLNEGQVDMYSCGKSLAAISGTDSEMRNVRVALQILLNEKQKDKAQMKIQEINTAYGVIDEKLAEYKTYLNGNSEDTANLEELENKITVFKASLEEVKSAVLAGDYVLANDLAYSGTYPTVRNEVFTQLQTMLNWNITAMENTSVEGEAIYNKSEVSIVVTIGFAILISVSLAIFIALGITKGLQYMQKLAGDIADGDLTVAFDKKMLKRKDEVGKLSVALNEMKDKTHKVIAEIVLSSNEILDMSDESNQRFVELNRFIQEISAATEELSAGMEETAASAEELNATAEEIDNAVEVVASRSQDGAKMAGEIASRANSLKEDFTVAKGKADDTFYAIRDGLEESLEEAKSVEKVNSLADAILGIADQTNLLALNAAIEAARAGEAGKGFAVVADEIRNLAENSKETATQILSVASTVIESVDSLVGDAHKLLKFVADDVTNDYVSMLDATADYSSAARDVDDMTADFSATSEELQASIQAVVTTVGEVTRAAAEGAETTGGIAEQVSKVANNAEVVMGNMNETKDNAIKLGNLVKGFKVNF
ncbi:methyl-accepting chemotaxis protein [Anaerosporobacter sp.]|uniref:methyl-accepting chemotaxis protein n=1 Tax=Anaerosporobacter sp. TaxID=1872529 RepID=UPI00286F61C2|nr:methyl-accepting chemotaxis protein [Anaerosporobacter sp.]